MKYRSFGFVFFFQAEDGIRDYKVTGVQTCALPIFERCFAMFEAWHVRRIDEEVRRFLMRDRERVGGALVPCCRHLMIERDAANAVTSEIGRASCRERGEIWVGGEGGKRDMKNTGGM